MPRKRATSTVPIVMLFSPDSVQAGYIESLARPGANVTGLSSMLVELSGKRLELFKGAFPTGGANTVQQISTGTIQSLLGRTVAS